MEVTMSDGAVHCMLDLETWGQHTGCAIRSIGAVIFDLEEDGVPDKPENRFYANIRDRSCWHAGLHVNRDTAAWWGCQSKEAQDVFAQNPQELGDVVRAFNSWFHDNRVKYVWAQGANFDPPLWEAASRAIGSEPPWKFYLVRDTRTVYYLADLDPRSITRAGVFHNALDDAVHQVHCVQAAYRIIKTRSGDAQDALISQGQKTNE